MTWSPVQQRNAIEWASAKLHFPESLNKAVLDRLLRQLPAHAEKCQLNTMKPAASAPKINVNGGNVQIHQPQTSGMVLERMDDGSVIEHICFKAERFGYVAQNYTCWADYLERISETTLSLLDTDLDLAPIPRITLEYWNKFTTDAGATIDAAEIIPELKPLPDAAEKAANWHVNANWAEKRNGLDFRVFHKVDFSSQQSGNAKATLGFYVKAELANRPMDQSLDTVKSSLSALRMVTHRSFSRRLSPSALEMINMSSEDYE